MKSLRLMDWDVPEFWEEYRIPGSCPGEGSEHSLHNIEEVAFLATPTSHWLAVPLGWISGYEQKHSLLASSPSFLQAYVS
jgi:hypothetical protein